MNQKLVESLVQIILSLSDEERRLLESNVQKTLISPQIADLESRLKGFEAKYQMPLENFHERFKSGELSDSTDFFEWNTYYEMRNAAQAKVS
ncbi:MAG TPA: hypothetical protein V6D34_08370 [Candidatus Sericytochromatia bacterium]|jgi:hypothetical protein